MWLCRKASLRAADGNKAHQADVSNKQPSPTPSDHEDGDIVEDACPLVKLERGPQISQKLAESLDTYWGKPYVYHKEEFLMPDNLVKIKTPGLNKDIWDNVSKQHRANDKNNLKLQQLLQAAAINTARNADVFVKSLRHNREDEVLKQALTSSLDTMSMLGTVSDSISRTRRSRLKNGLNANINSICEIHYDEDTLQGRASDYLFGNDLNDTIARGERHRKIATQVRKDVYPYPKSSGQQSHSRSSDFRRGRGFRRPPNQRYQQRGRAPYRAHNRR